jgi:2-polyprenyl-3-methyl-5-hydroxy-6-metoxy-1,4-benzoquinol methylase
MALANPRYKQPHVYRTCCPLRKLQRVSRYPPLTLKLLKYYSYYTKRGNHFSDPRLRALPPGLFKGKRVLDVGCNEGWVTCEIGRQGYISSMALVSLGYPQPFAMMHKK